MGVERRRHPRLAGRFRGRLRGVDVQGRSFDLEALVRDISAGGLCAVLQAAVGSGRRLFAAVELPTGAVLAARGRAVWSGAGSKGWSGVGMQFTRTRLMPSGAVAAALRVGE